METAEVTIVGGGIVGSSIAYHLTAAGCRDVLVLERETQQGKGSTGKSMGGVRAQFSTPVNIQMSLYSIPFYAGFEERLGEPSGYLRRDTCSWRRARPTSATCAPTRSGRRRWG